MNTTYSLVCGLAEILHTADFQEANQQAALQADHRQKPVAVYAHLNSGEQMLMALIQPNRLNQLDLLGLPGVSGFDLAPTVADSALAALETQDKPVLRLITRYWQDATTRKDWRTLEDWVDALAARTAFSVSPGLLAEYTLLSGIAHHHRINSNGGAKP